MNVSEMPLLERLAYIAALAEPLDRLSLLAELREEQARGGEIARDLTRSAIADLRSEGWTFAKIGEVLGVSAQRVEQLSR